MNTRKRDVARASGRGAVEVVAREAPGDFNELAIREHMDISNATENALDVTEWVSNASVLMKNMDLGERMWRCEEFLLYDIIEPMVSAPLPPPG